MRHLFSMLTLCALLVSPPVFAFVQIIDNGLAYSLSLKEAILLALRENPNIQSSEYSQILTKFNLRVQQNVFEPQYAVNGSANTARTKSNNVLSHSQSYILTPSVNVTTVNGGNISGGFENNSSGTTYNPLFTLQLTQPLMRGARQSIVETPLFNAYDQVRIGKLSLKNTIISNVTSVIQNYRNLIQAEINLDIQQESLKEAQITVSQTKTQIKAGTSAASDLAQAQQQVEQFNLTVLQAQNSLIQAREALLQQIGIDPTLPISVPRKVVLPNYKLPDTNESVKTALANDPTYQSDLITLKIDERNVMVAEDQKRWQLDATATATWGGGSGGAPNNNFQSLINGTNTGQSVGLTLTVPINNYSVKSQIVSAKVAVEQQRVQTQFDKQTVVNNVINAIAGLKAAQDGLTIAKQNTQLARLNLNNGYIQYKYGQMSILNITQLQTALTSARQSELTNDINYLNAITQYQQVIQSTLKDWDIKVRY